MEILKTENATTIEINTALCIRATRDCVDRTGKQRVFGEMWLIRTPGVYLPGAYESIVETRTAFNITDKVNMFPFAIPTMLVIIVLSFHGISLLVSY